MKTINNSIDKAVDILRQGGLVIFPTDTAFGIGCRIDLAGSVRRLFRVRRRPETQAVPVLVGSVAMAEKYLLSPLPNNVRHIMEDYWPGGLTLIYKCKPELVTPLVRGGGENLGVRMPDHKNVLDMINKTGVPILGPSANFHGEATPYSLPELNKALISEVDYVLEGECKTKMASTVIDASGLPLKILRRGKVVIDLEKYTA